MIFFLSLHPINTFFKICYHLKEGDSEASPEHRPISAPHSLLAEGSVMLWESGDDLDRDHELKEVLFAFLLHEKIPIGLSRTQLVPSTARIEHLE